MSEGELSTLRTRIRELDSKLYRQDYAIKTLFCLLVASFALTVVVIVAQTKLAKRIEKVESRDAFRVENALICDTYRQWTLLAKQVEPGMELLCAAQRP